MTNKADEQYLNLLREIIDTGERQLDRTGVGTISIFGTQMRFNLQEGFPLLTTKKLHTKSIFEELFWFLRGSTNNTELQDRGVSIWDEWADKDGELGPIYGKQWRAWEGPDGTVIDQIGDLVALIKKSPASRRMVVTAWNPADIDKVALAWCHCLFQVRVSNGKLSLQLYQRSADFCLGIPFNIASYALLTHMLAQQCDLEVGDFIWTGGDTHVYSNHLEQAAEQLSRTPRDLPTLRFARKPDSIDDYRLDDIIIEGYDPHPAIKMPVAV